MSLSSAPLAPWRAVNAWGASASVGVDMVDVLPAWGEGHEPGLLWGKHISIGGICYQETGHRRALCIHTVGSQTVAGLQVCSSREGTVRGCSSVLQPQVTGRFGAMCVAVTV